MSPTLRAALALVRGWTRLYTACMQPALRDARRDEIESDLWEFHEDARRRGFSPEAIGVLMLLRLVLGVADDLSWRIENRAPQGAFVAQALWAAAVASVVILWSLMSALQTHEPPLSPVGTGNIVRMLYPLHVRPATPSAQLPTSQMTVRVHLMAPPPPPPSKP